MSMRRNLTVTFLFSPSAEHYTCIISNRSRQSTFRLIIVNKNREGCLIVSTPIILNVSVTLNLQNISMHGSVGFDAVETEISLLH